LSSWPPSCAWCGPRRKLNGNVVAFGPEGTLHTIHTEVTQRETWTRTPEGWKLLFVDEVRDQLTLDDGRRVK